MPGIQPFDPWQNLKNTGPGSQGQGLQAAMATQQNMGREGLAWSDQMRQRNTARKQREAEMAMQRRSMWGSIASSGIQAGAGLAGTMMTPGLEAAARLDYAKGIDTINKQAQAAGNVMQGFESMAPAAMQGSQAIGIVNTTASALAYGAKTYADIGSVLTAADINDKMLADKRQAAAGVGVGLPETDYGPTTRDQVTRGTVQWMNGFQDVGQVPDYEGQLNVEAVMDSLGTREPTMTNLMSAVEEQMGPMGRIVNDGFEMTRKELAGGAKPPADFQAIQDFPSSEGGMRVYERLAREIRDRVATGAGPIDPGWVSVADEIGNLSQAHGQTIRANLASKGLGKAMFTPEVMMQMQTDPTSAMKAAWGNYQKISRDFGAFVESAQAYQEKASNAHWADVKNYQEGLVTLNKALVDGNILEVAPEVLANRVQTLQDTYGPLQGVKFNLAVSALKLDAASRGIPTDWDEWGWGE